MRNSAAGDENRMNTLENIENMLERLTNEVETLLVEREEMLVEMAHLRARLTERDKDAVKASQAMRVELELTQADALRAEQERLRIESKLRGLNDRLIALVHNGKERRRG